MRGRTFRRVKSSFSLHLLFFHVLYIAVQRPSLLLVALSFNIHELISLLLPTFLHAPPIECTFILLDKTHPAASPPLFAPCTMVGDVNLFFNDPDGDMGVAEIEIMIAEPTRRGRGLGMEGVEAMMQYAIEALGVRRFYCKISDSNVASLRMFERWALKEREGGAWLQAPACIVFGGLRLEHNYLRQAPTWDGRSDLILLAH